MSRVHVNLIGIVFGLLIVSITLFRFEIFRGQDVLVHVFVGMVSAGLVIMVAGLSRLSGFKGRYGLVALILFEISLAGVFRTITVTQTRRTPEGVKSFLNLVYGLGFMNVAQFDKSVSLFDSQLQYLFRPGVHQFDNPEFKSVLNINSAGFRDDEASVDYPEVVFLGDSFTMGWGVSEDESFEKIVENEINVNALNAGVASYGTAREQMLLERLKLDSCKLMLIQYCSNDLVENYMFSKNGGRLVSADKLREGYDERVRINTLNSNYFPFKHVYWLLKGSMMYTGFSAWVGSLQKPLVIVEGPSETDHGRFLDEVLRTIRKKYQGAIVLYHLDIAFPEELTRQLERVAANPELKIHWLDISKIGLLPDDYFLLDPHINVSGHKKVAASLSSFIREKGFLANLN